MGKFNGRFLGTLKEVSLKCIKQHQVEYQTDMVSILDAGKSNLNLTNALAVKKS